MATPVTLEDINVMYVASTSGLEGVKEAWDKLEARLPSLKGRKFYGTYQHQIDEYRACVALMDDDEPAKMGLDTWVMPGGKYVRRKLMDWRERIEDIGKTFDSMAQEHDPDHSRPSIEFYRSQKELFLFLPVK